MTQGYRADTYGHDTGDNVSASRGGWRDTATRYALLPLRLFLGITFI